MKYAGDQKLKGSALENNSFAASFYAFRIKKDYTKVEKKVRWGLDYRLVKIMYSLECGYASEVVSILACLLTLMHKNNPQDWLKSFQ